MNCSTPGLPVHHQLPEFTQTHIHRVGDAIPMGFPRQEYWNELPFPPPGDLPNPEVKPASSALPAGS